MRREKPKSIDRPKECADLTAFFGQETFIIPPKAEPADLLREQPFDGWRCQGFQFPLQDLDMCCGPNGAPHIYLKGLRRRNPDDLVRVDFGLVDPQWSDSFRGDVREWLLESCEQLREYPDVAINPDEIHLLNNAPSDSLEFFLWLHEHHVQLTGTLETLSWICTYLYKTVVRLMDDVMGMPTYLDKSAFWGFIGVDSRNEERQNDDV